MNRAMLPRLLYGFLLLNFFSCQNDRKAQAVLHTGMGDIRLQLFDETPQHRDNFIAAASGLNNDSLQFYRIERDFTIQFGPWPADSSAHDTSVDAEIKALPTGGALAAVALEKGKLSDGSDFFLVLDHPQNDASLNALEKKLNRKFSDSERRAYKKLGGLPQLQGQVTVFGKIVQGLDVAQRIAAMPRDSAGRPLSKVRLWIEIVR